MTAHDVAREEGALNHHLLKGPIACAVLGDLRAQLLQSRREGVCGAGRAFSITKLR